MPRVKLNTPEVDSLNAVKKRVIRKNKAKYSGQESAAPVVREETQQIYNGIADKLTGIVAAIGEINAQLNLTAGINAPWASKAIDRYISATSAAKKQISDLNTFLEQNVGSLANLSEAQLTAIAKLQEELTATFTEIVQSVNRLSPKRQVAIKKVFSVFVDDLVRLNQVLQGNIGFRQTTSSTTQGIPVHPFKHGAKADPEQELASPEKQRKKRKDAGMKRKTKLVDAAGDEPASPAKATRSRSKLVILDSDGTDADADTERGLGYSGGGLREGDRMIGGLVRRMPISFPAMMRKETQGGVFLSSENYMPTRFL